MTESGTPHDAGVCNEAVDAGPPCTVITCIPPVINPFNSCCATSQLAIYGTAMQCGDAATMCQTLCPGTLEIEGGTTTLYDCALSGRNVSCNYGPAPCYVTGRRPRGLQPCAPSRAPSPTPLAREHRDRERGRGMRARTFGVAVAVVQSLSAEDPAVRAAMRRIAKDETRHAELAWQVGRWLETRLDGPARARVARARIPCAPVAGAMVQDLTASLWGRPPISSSSLEACASPRSPSAAAASF